MTCLISSLKFLINTTKRPHFIFLYDIFNLVYSDYWVLFEHPLTTYAFNYFLKILYRGHHIHLNNKFPY